jgi:copper(I)-binding protein
MSRRDRSGGRAAAAALTVALALTACAGPAGSPDLRPGPARASVPTAGVSLLVLDLTNVGDGDDRLVGAETDAALAVELHLTEVDGEGRAVMRRLDAILLPAGGTVRFRPGGPHLMLVVPDERVVLGATLAVTLRFERSEPVTLPVRVVPTVELLEDDPGEPSGEDAGRRGP